MTNYIGTHAEAQDVLNRHLTNIKATFTRLADECPFDDVAQQYRGVAAEATHQLKAREAAVKATKRRMERV